MRDVHWDKSKLQRIWQSRQLRPAALPIREYLERFLKKSLAPRRKSTGPLTQAWFGLLPPDLLEHTFLDSFRRGQLTVLVDTAAHLAELNWLLREGFEKRTKFRRRLRPFRGILLKAVLHELRNFRGKIGTQGRQSFRA